MRLCRLACHGIVTTSVQRENGKSTTANGTAAAPHQSLRPAIAMTRGNSRSAQVALKYRRRMPGNDFAEPDGTSSGSLAAVTRYAVDAQPLSINSPAATPSVKFLRVFMSLFLCCFVLDRINRIYKIVFKQCSAGDAEEFSSAPTQLPAYLARFDHEPLVPLQQSPQCTMPQKLRMSSQATIYIIAS